MRLSKARKEAVVAVMKETIFEAAGSVLEMHGVGGMTMDRVAATAGLTAGSLYNYFRNKGELMQFVHARLVEPLFEAVEGAATSDLPAPERLRAILQTVRDAVIEHRALLRVLSEGGGGEEQLRRDGRLRLLQILNGVFEQGVQEGAFRPHNAAHSSRMFHGSLAELFELVKEGASDEEVNSFAALLIDAVFGEFLLLADKDATSAAKRRRSSRS
ncbi:MAG: hypothetical protein CMJ58_01400 [Planctomycetaceae bacterium]|nr:hypothetical protein [Planctomycetaceae bacterium]